MTEQRKMTEEEAVKQCEAELDAELTAFIETLHPAAQEILKSDVGPGFRKSAMECANYVARTVGVNAGVNALQDPLKGVLYHVAPIVALTASAAGIMINERGLSPREAQAIMNDVIAFQNKGGPLMVEKMRARGFYTDADDDPIAAPDPHAPPPDRPNPLADHIRAQLVQRYGGEIALDPAALDLARKCSQDVHRRMLDTVTLVGHPAAGIFIYLYALQSIVAAISGSFNVIDPENSKAAALEMAKEVIVAMLDRASARARADV